MIKSDVNFILYLCSKTNLVVNNGNIQKNEFFRMGSLLLEMIRTRLSRARMRRAPLHLRVWSYNHLPRQTSMLGII